MKSTLSYIAFVSSLVFLLCVLIVWLNTSQPTSLVPTSNNSVSVWHDDERNVTCWLYFQQGISCIPNTQIGQ